MKFSLLLALTTWLSLSLAALAQTVPAPAAPKAVVAAADTAARLFAEDSVLQFTLTCALRNLLKDRGDTPVEHPVLLTYANDQKQPVALAMKAKVRGNFRRNSAVCTYPPLLLDFPKKKTQNTLFEAQKKLKLVTHCQTEEYVVREYLVYKLYNLITDVSFRARLARVTYADSAGKRAPETHWAFLLEDEDALAKRHGAKINPLKQTRMERANSLSMATVAVFEYLIGNTDWSVPFLHNIKLLAVGTDALPVPVPYDFDHAGIVEAKYAFPAEQLNIESVRQRLYRGPVYPITIFQKVFDRFNQVKPQLYALYANETRLNPGYVKRTLKYLDDFYAVINKPASVQTEFLKGARSPVVIKGLNK
ncbi:MAG: hypothetical protein LH606_14330 [Cytophagaceae bacterium]|nr:hypothetical protein [Cytophagaceae bacterium]